LKENKSCAFKTSIGGQALIEGILMRGPKKQSIVCRTAEGLVEKVEELKVGKDKYPILGWPFIRGLFIFLSSMINGMSALMYSAELVPLEEQEEDKLDKWIKEHFSEEKATKIIIYVAVVLGIALSLFLFIFLPAFIVGIIKPLTANYVVRNLSEGMVRVAILLIYMKACTAMGDIKRLFSYHGAEHKTIFCYENGLELTVENVRKQRRFHPRCGTSFLILMLIISIGIGLCINPVYKLVTGNTANTLIFSLIKLCLLPLTMGIGYELIKLAGRHDNLFTRIISAPGMWLQRITVKEFPDDMIECAIAAFKEVIPEDDTDKI
jgi:uncharacterized protein YqhQ